MLKWYFYFYIKNAVCNLIFFYKSLFSYQSTDLKMFLFPVSIIALNNTTKAIKYSTILLCVCIKYIKFIYIGHLKLMCGYWRQVKELLWEMSGRTVWAEDTFVGVCYEEMLALHFHFFTFSVRSLTFGI